MQYIKKARVISKKNSESGFEYFLRMPNRRMISIFSEKDVVVGTELYVLYDYIHGEFHNVVFA